MNMWDFKESEKVYEAAETMFEKALLAEIERLAKLVIDTIPKVKSFCMAMGSASFYCEWEEFEEEDPTDTWKCTEHCDPYELKDGNQFAEDLNDLFEKYNDKFRLTGCPMKIDRDNLTGELITVTDW